MSHNCKLLSVVGSASPPVLFRRRDLYRPLRVHRLTMSMSRPKSDLGAGSGSRPRPDLGAGKPSTTYRPVTPSDKEVKSFSAQTTTGRSLSSLTSTTVANVPVHSDGVTRRSRAVTASSPSSALRDTVKPAAAAAAASSPRDSSRAESTTLTVSKLSRTLVKSLSADKAKPSLTRSEDNAAAGRDAAVSKSQSTTNVKKQGAKSRTDAVDKEISKKDTKTFSSAKVPASIVFTDNYLC